MKLNYKIIGAFFVLFIVLSGASCDLKKDKQISNSAIGNTTILNKNSNNIKQKPEVTQKNLTQDNNIVQDAKTNNNVKEFNVKMSQFKYDPSVIEVNVGDKVIINATSTDVTHGFMIPALNLNIIARPGETVSQEFVADKAGTYIIRCSVYCGIGHNEMTATLIVH